jgi:hypothetical protein
MGAIIKYKYPILPTVNEEESLAAGNFMLYQNFPNPFNPLTTIEYNIKEANFVTLVIYDILGKEINRLVNTYKAAGSHRIQWNAENFPSGIYYYRVKSGGFMDSKKMMLLR